MDLKNIYQKIAEKHNVSAKEVENDIMEAIKHMNETPSTNTRHKKKNRTKTDKTSTEKPRLKSFQPPRNAACFS